MNKKRKFDLEDIRLTISFDSDLPLTGDVKDPFFIYGSDIEISLKIYDEGFQKTKNGPLSLGRATASIVEVPRYFKFAPKEYSFVDIYHDLDCREYHCDGAFEYLVDHHTGGYIVQVEDLLRSQDLYPETTNVLFISNLTICEEYLGLGLEKHIIRAIPRYFGCTLVTLFACGNSFKILEKKRKKSKEENLVSEEGITQNLVKYFECLGFSMLEKFDPKCPVMFTLSDTLCNPKRKRGKLSYDPEKEVKVPEQAKKETPKLCLIQNSPGNS